MVLELDYQAHIVPGSSMAGLRIGMHLSEFEPAIWASWYGTGRKSQVYAMNWLFSVTYSIDSVKVDVDVHTGCIYALTAEAGYGGHASVDGCQIFVGSSIAEVTKRIPTLFYNDPENRLEFEGLPGIALQTTDSGPEPRSSTQSKVATISVYNVDPACFNRVLGLDSQMLVRKEQER